MEEPACGNEKEHGHGYRKVRGRRRGSDERARSPCWSCNRPFSAAVAVKRAARRLPKPATQSGFISMMEQCESPGYTDIATTASSAGNGHGRDRVGGGGGRPSASGWSARRGSWASVLFSRRQWGSPGGGGGEGWSSSGSAGEQELWREIRVLGQVLGADAAAQLS